MEETTTTPGQEAVQAGRRIGRRELLGALAVSSAAVAASALVPRKWGKPLVEVGLLPVHAAVSPAPTMTSTPTATPTGTQTPTDTPTPTLTLVRCGLPATPTQISPPDHTISGHPQPDLTLVWSTVPVPEGCPGVTYGIEIQWEEPDVGWRVELEESGLTSPSQTFPLAVPGAYRWRVWASTTAGDSSSSGWWDFQFLPAQ